MDHRKIIHIDMDAFFASVEQRDSPKLKGKPVAVGGGHERGVVCAASYEARKYGVRSAMSGKKAKELCPDLIFVPPRFDAYKEASQIIREIFHDYTNLVEPLSLDEAYLDVTNNHYNIPYATQVAKDIRSKIYERTELTASAMDERVALDPTDFGGKPEEKELVTRLHQTKEGIPKNGIIIDATAPLEHVVGKILKKCN